MFAVTRQCTTTTTKWTKQLVKLLLRKQYVVWVEVRRKRYSTNISLNATKLMAHMLHSRLALRAAVCRKVLTGNKITHAASTQYLPERIEEEYEWVCDDPILAPTK